jgi:hypothetical protein
VKQAPAGVLLVANILFFWPVLFHGRVFSSHDVVAAGWPWRAASGIETPRNRMLADPATASETLLRHFRDFPHGFFWNASTGGGVPGPFNFVQGNLSPFFWLPAIVLPEAAIETAILALKLNLGFFFAWLFLRSRRYSPTAAAAGAAAWALTSAQSVWWLWMQTSVSVVFPLLLWSVDRAFRQERFARAAVPAALVFAGLLSGGYPHWIALGAFAAALFFVVEAAGRPLRRSIAAAARLAVGALLAAAILSPAILVSARFLKATGQIAAREGVGQRFPMPLRQIRLYVAPDFAGDPWADDYRGVGLGDFDNYFETAAGVGPFALGLAGIGLANRKRRRLAVFCAVLGLSVAVPLYAGGWPLRVAGALPVVSHFLFERAKILIVLAIALAVPAGVEALEELLAEGSAARRLLAAVPYAIAVPLVFIAAETYPAIRPADAVFRSTPGLDALATLPGPSRFLATGWTIEPNTAEAYGIEDVRSHLMHERDYRRLLTAADPGVYGQYGTFLLFDPRELDVKSPVLDLLGVAAIATPPGVDRPDSEEAAAADAGELHSVAIRHEPTALPVIYRGPDLTVFSRPTAFPRFFAVSRVTAGGVEEARIASRETLGSTAFVGEADRAALSSAIGSSDAAAARIRLAGYRPERFALEVDTPSPVLLVSSEKVLDPYWRAFVDGRPAPLVLCDGMFFGALVPAGRHTVEGRFMIPVLEKIVSVGAVLALAALSLAAIRHNVTA